MAFTRPTKNELKTRIGNDFTSRLSGTSSIFQNALIQVFVAVYAGLFHILYGVLAQLEKEIFVKTAGDITPHEEVSPLTRKPAAYASGSILITGTAASVIPVDTVFQRSDNTDYKTANEVTIPAGGSIAVDVEASVAGLDGNVDSGILSLVSPIAGVDNDATIESDGISGGADLESDTSLVARIVKDQQTGATEIGNLSDYERWAESVSGVRKAWAYRAYSGAGTIGLSFAATGTNPIPSATLRNTVQAYIEDSSRMPGAASLTMITLSQVSLSLTVHPVEDLDDDTKTTIRENIQELIFDKVTPGDYMPFSVIHQAFQQAGVRSYTVDNVTVNWNDGTGEHTDHGENDISLSAGQIVVLTSLTWVE